MNSYTIKAQQTLTHMLNIVKLVIFMCDLMMRVCVRVPHLLFECVAREHNITLICVAISFELYMYVQLAMSSNDSKSIYLKAFDELYPLLVESLTSDYADLTNILFSKSLVSDVTRKTIISRTTGKTETERTGILLDAVRNRISQKSDNFDQFLKVLRDSELQVYKDVAKLLQQRIFSLSKQINSELQDPKYKKRSTKKCWILLTGESIYSNGIYILLFSLQRVTNKNLTLL